MGDFGTEQLTPESFQRNLKLGKVICDLLEVIPAGIAPSALVEAEGPVLLHGGQTDSGLLVGLHNGVSSRSSVEVEVNGASKASPGDVGLPEQDLLGVSVAEENSVGVRSVVGILVRGIGDVDGLLGIGIDLVVAGIEIDRVRAIDISIDWVTDISRVECAYSCEFWYALARYSGYLRVRLLFSLKPWITSPSPYRL